MEIGAPLIVTRSLTGVMTALCLAALCGCSGSKQEQAPAGKKGGGRSDAPTPVMIGHAVRRDVPIQAEVIGTVEASATVSIKPQISGQIIAARFHEGDYVTKGQLLFQIDPRALEAQLNQLQAQVRKDQAAMGQAQANLVRDQAQQQRAKVQLDRADQLLKDGIISKDQYDQFATTAATFDATIQADLAAIENTKAQVAASSAAVENQKVLLGYTNIYAPIGGRTGTITIKPGNIVQANNTELATINQVQPVYVTFGLPEGNLTALRQAAGQRLPVAAAPEEGGVPHKGTLAFFENSVDASTGTVKSKATFANEDRALWPGQFVRVTLKLGDRPNAILIPSQAVQSGQDGTFAYIVGGEQKVELRNIKAGERLGDETVILSGIQVGETVVTEGTLRLVPGARVTVRDRPQGGAAGRAAAPAEGEAPAAPSPEGAEKKGKRGKRPPTE